MRDVALIAIVAVWAVVVAYFGFGAFRELGADGVPRGAAGLAIAVG